MERELEVGAATGAVLARAQLSEDCGCGAKLAGEELVAMVCSAVTAASTPGGDAIEARQPEDCAVIATDTDKVLLTVDFGPLVARDARRAGWIAAMHALSDVYAMGGVPLAASAILVVDRGLPADAASSVLAGMFAAGAAEGAPVAGGHTVVGAEAMAGLAVVGSAPAYEIGKDGAQPNDILMLSKPVGVGMVLRAYRYGLLDDAGLEPALVSMERSNRMPAAAASAAGVHAATDVTGFGLLGHLGEMLGDSGLGARIELSRVPVLDAIHDLPEAFARSSRMKDNLEYCERRSPVSTELARSDLAPLLDPQTSGGLLVAAPRETEQALTAAGFRPIGTITRTPGIEVVG
jgi:selenide, water dikinase